MGNRVSTVGPIAAPPTSADLANAVGAAMRSNEEKMHEALTNLKDANQISVPSSGGLVLGRIIPMKPPVHKN